MTDFEMRKVWVVVLVVSEVVLMHQTLGIFFLHFLVEVSVEGADANKILEKILRYVSRFLLRML